MRKIIKVIVANSFKLIRDGVISQLKDQNDFVIIGDAEDWDQLVYKCCKSKPDVCISDVSLVNGYTGGMFRESGMNTKFLFITQEICNEHIYKVNKFGGLSLLSLNITIYELSHAIKEVFEERCYYQSGFDHGRINDIIKTWEKMEKADKHNIQFTEREKQVLKLLGEGATTNVIAEKLFLSTSTVSFHYRNLQAKTGSININQLICFAAKLEPNVLKPR